LKILCKILNFLTNFDTRHFDYGDMHTMIFQSFNFIYRLIYLYFDNKGTPTTTTSVTKR